MSVLAISRPGVARADRTAVELLFEGAFEPALVESVRADLRASLGLLDLEVVDDRRGLVRIELHLDLEGDPRVRVHIADGITHKEVDRVVPLVAVPEDSRSLVIASATDELMRASLAELRTPDVAPRRWWSLGVAAALDYYDGGLTQVGGDLRVQVAPLRWLAFFVDLGGRYAPRVQTDRGSLETWMLGGGLGVMVDVLPENEVAALFVLAHARAAAVGASAHPNDLSWGRSSWGAAVYFGGGLRLELLPRGEWRPFAEITVSGPAREVVFADELAPVAGVSGVSVGGRVGLALSL